MYEEELKFDKYSICYDPEEDDGFQVVLYDNETEEMIDHWKNIGDARFDIDNSPVGEVITLEEWQKLWDWADFIAVLEKAFADGMLQ